MQDVAARRAAHSVRQWVVAIAFFSAILAAIAFLPGIGAFVDLDLRAALGLWLLCGLFQLASVFVSVRRPAYDSVSLAMSLVSAFLLQAYLCGLVDLVSPHAAPVFASVFALVAAYHAIQFRSATRFPFVPALTGVSAAIAWCFAPSTAHETVFAVVGPLATMGALLSAGQALASHDAKREQERLREALRSQELLVAKSEIDRLSEGINNLLGAVHDISNALGTIRAEADFLALATGTDDLDPAEIRETSEALLGSVEVAARVAHDAKLVGRGGLLAPIEPVMLEPVVAAALASARIAHPMVEFVDASRAAASVCMRVRGGEATLRRMLENLLINAVQGDGTRGAHRVELAVDRDAMGLNVSLHIRDDGPGFRSDLLREPIRALDTTKEDGTGVGLFTVERFAVASGGLLQRQNRDEGGAQVTLILPQEHA